MPTPPPRPTPRPSPDQRGPAANRGRAAHPRATRPVLALLLALSLLVPALVAVPGARAADCAVGTTADTGPFSLRAAIANTGAFDDCATITVTATGTIALQGSLPPIRRALTITGPGSGALTIAGDGTFPLLTIDAPGQAVALAGLSLVGGRAVGGFGGNLRSVGGNVGLTDVVLSGGRADAGLSGAGAYLSNGTSTLTRVTITGNTAPGTRTYPAGAGLFGDEYFGETDVTIAGGMIADNVATDWGGAGVAVVRDSGMASRTLIVRIADATISNNRVTNQTEGAGLHNYKGTVMLTNSTVGGNATAGLGAGIFSVGTLTVINSTVVSNRGGSLGGGILSFGTMTVTNSTIASNHAVGGGGLLIAGTTTVTSSTIVGNTADTVGGGLYTYGQSVLHAGRNIIAGNLANGAPDDCKVTSPAVVVSEGDNLVGSGTGCPTSGTGDLVLTGALATVLDPVLADNGGPTRTHNLVVGGSATDRIPPDRCGVTTDQRGVPRPQNGRCDIGAVEYSAAPPPPSSSPSPSPPSPSPGPPAAPCGQRFGDVPAADPACVAVEALAARAIINGCDASAVPPLFCPADTTLRAQMAALIVRAMPGWSAETWPNTFTDQTGDAELMRRVGTLQHYGVAGGYNDCAAQGKVAPCYGPLDPVLRAQAISFVTRAMVARGYWIQQPASPALYGGALLGSGHEGDASTYWYYTRARGGVPDYPEGGGFPLGEAAPRAWFARLLWTAIQGTPAAP